MSIFRIFRRYSSTQDVKQFLKNSQSGYDRVLNKVNIIEAGKGICVAEMKVEKEHTNPLNGLHGGLSATLIDSLTSYALLTHEKCLMVPSVSVDIHVSYLKGATIGEEIVINAQTIRAGKTLAYLKCEIKNKESGDVLVKGSHTKYLLR